MGFPVLWLAEGLSTVAPVLDAGPSSVHVSPIHARTCLFKFRSSPKTAITGECFSDKSPLRFTGSFYKLAASFGERKKRSNETDINNWVLGFSRDSLEVCFSLPTRQWAEAHTHTQKQKKQKQVMTQTQSRDNPANMLMSSKYLLSPQFGSVHTSHLAIRGTWFTHSLHSHGYIHFTHAHLDS